jgi:hypothetical protein
MSAAANLQSTLTCPHCAARSTHTMPTNACVWFQECAACGEWLKPKPGDCCVFCSYGDARCPPQQTGSDCCGASSADLNETPR